MATQQSVKDKLAGKAGAVATTEKQDNTLAGFLERTKHEWGKALPAHVTAERLARIAVSTVNRTPALARCSMQSLVGGVMISSQLGLELNTPLGHAYLIPYKRSIKQGNNWTQVEEAQFQIGYQGIIDLAYRTGLYLFIDATPVYSNDEFSYQLGLHRDLIHKPTEGEPGELIGIYAQYEMKNGAKNFKYWSIAKILAHAKKYSQSWDAKTNAFKPKSAWGDNFESMARVPVLKDLLKLAPKSIEFAKQLSLDGAVKTGVEADMTEAEGINVEYSVLTQETGELPMTPEEANEAAPEADAAQGDDPFASSDTTK